MSTPSSTSRRPPSPRRRTSTKPVCSPLSTVNVMLAIEDELGIEFPESMLNRRTFECIAAIADAVEQLQMA